MDATPLVFGASLLTSSLSCFCRLLLTHLAPSDIFSIELPFCRNSAVAASAKSSILGDNDRVALLPLLAVSTFSVAAAVAVANGRLLPLLRRDFRETADTVDIPALSLATTVSFLLSLLNRS